MKSKLYLYFWLQEAKSNYYTKGRKKFIVRIPSRLMKSKEETDQDFNTVYPWEVQESQPM